jgi:hypothetical protein
VPPYFALQLATIGPLPLDPALESIGTFPEVVLRSGLQYLGENQPVFGFASRIVSACRRPFATWKSRKP